MHYSAEKGLDAMLAALLDRGADVNQSGGFFGESPLFRASSHGNLEVVKMLLERSAAINQQSVRDGTTPLIIAAQRDQLIVVEILLGRGADVNLAGNNGESPLYVAASKGHVAVVEALLKHGAEVNQPDSHSGWTPLSVAAYDGDLVVVKLLLKHGAEVDHKDARGFTALHVAVKSNQSGSSDVAGELIKHRAATDATDDDGNTPLHIASSVNNLAAVEELLSHGAVDIDDVNVDNMTSLLIAADKGHHDMVMLLLDRGAYVEELNISLINDNDIMRTYLQVIVGEREHAQSDDVGHFCDAIMAGVLLAPIAQWLPLLTPDARAELSAWTASCLADARGHYSASYHGDNADGSSSVRCLTNPTGPISDYLTGYLVYPTAATRELLLDVAQSLRCMCANGFI